MNGINTTLCYLKRGEEYLMLHRVKKEGDLNKDKWIGIGGKFEAGESPEDCLCREVLEETGLTLHSWRYRGIVTFVSDEYGTEYMHLFDSEDFSGEIKDCDEGDLEWIHRGRLLELTLWEGDRIFLRLLETDCPYMAPEPVRGIRCDSSLVRYVGAYIAQRKALAPEEVFRTTAANARRVFGL